MPAEVSSTRDELKELQADAKKILDRLKKSVVNIKDNNKKQRLMQWERKDYRELSKSFNDGLRSKDVETQGKLIEEIKDKLAEGNLLLE